MHPLVRDLYKRVLHVGRDYPTGLAHVKEIWKKALRNPDNCPHCYGVDAKLQDESQQACEEEILRAVHKGRFMVKEMVGVIKLKKYRAMKQRYETNPDEEQRQANEIMQKAMDRFETKGAS
jgi:hypothetical protein